MNRPGSLIGGALLITGSCVGAGMLGLPILTGLAGFGPAVIMFLIACFFMIGTGFLLVEVNGWFTKPVNLLSMVEQTLGRVGKSFCLVIYLFLFYALLVAYIAASGSICSSLVQSIFGFTIPSWLGSLFFVLLFGHVVYRGTRQVDFWNRVLMVGKILFFLSLIFVGVRQVDFFLLQRVDFSFSLYSLPILIVSFGYHNMIPTLTTYMKGDLKKVRLSILFGSALAFFIYLAWEFLVLGIVPLGGAHGLLQTYCQDQEGAQALARFVSSPWIGLLAQGLAFFAILTSFLAQSLSFVHFFADGFKVSHEKKESRALCALALGPPLILSLIYPKLFFKALNFAGGICAILLFGVIPICAVWIGRYIKKTEGPYTLPGGKILLLLILLVGLFIFCMESLFMSGVLSMPIWCL